MTIEFTDRCRRCSWTNEHNARRCRGCGRLLPQGTALPLRAAGYRRSSVIGTVVWGPEPMKMPVLQPFWFIITAALIVGEAGLDWPRTALAGTMAVMFALATGVHRAARSHYWAIARTARWLDPIRMHTGLRIGISDAAGVRWVLHFLPASGTDLHLGDPMFADGHENRAGEFRALRLTNTRTGYRHLSMWTMVSGIASTCTAIMGAVVIMMP